MTTAHLNRDGEFNIGDIASFLALFDNPNTAAQIFNDARYPIPEQGITAVLPVTLGGLVRRRRG